MSKSNMYEDLGIDPSKQGVREIFEKIIDNEYPGAFVNIITDPFCAKRVITQHQDGDGSKFVQRMIHYLESGDSTVFRGMVDDALSMNTGDIAASGFVAGPWLITDVLNVNLSKELKKVVMKEVAIRLAELKQIYAKRGIRIILSGGETADLPDQVRSGVFDIAITAWADKTDLIKGNVQKGDVIYGFSSDGKAAWETTENSGMMSNGLTLARSCLMSKNYNSKYPHLKREEDFYKGNYHYNDSVDLLNGLTVGDALISPTRQWALVIKMIIDCLKTSRVLHMLHGISMNTGGGATKIKNVGQGGILYVKNMPSPPPLFKLIQRESGETWENMFQNFNCGIGIDVVGENNDSFYRALKRATFLCHLSFYHLGICQKLPTATERNKVMISTPYDVFWY